MPKPGIEDSLPKRVSYDNEVLFCGLQTTYLVCHCRRRYLTKCRHCINHVTVTRFSRFLAYFRATINALLTHRVTS